MTVRKFCLIAGLLVGVQLTAWSAEEARYLPADKPDAIVLLAPPPLPGSAEQAADLATVVAVEHQTSDAERAAALAQKKFDVFAFAGAIGDDFKPGRYPQTEALFGRLQKTTDEIANRAKEHWHRDRPYVVEPSLAKGMSEKSTSYPSGHSTRGTVFALVLADLFPAKRDAILAVGRTIGWHRVQIGAHYPTDVYAGRVLAQAIVRELHKSPAFQIDFERAQQEVAAPELAPVR